MFCFCYVRSSDAGAPTCDDFSRMCVDGGAIEREVWKQVTRDSPIEKYVHERANLIPYMLCRTARTP